MKTNYLPRSRPRRSSTKSEAIIVLLVLLIGSGLLTLFKSELSSMFSPMWRGQNVMSRGVSNTISWFSSKDSLIRENYSLREKLISQEAELSALRDVESREKELLSILGRRVETQGILVAVMVRPPETPYDVLVVDAGVEDGVEVGDLAAAPEGPLLGIISETLEDTSKVRLYTSDGERTNAILERHGVPVILEGQGGGNFRVTLPREVEVEEGDRILSPDINADLLGVVNKINMSPTDAFKEVIGHGAANLFTIKSIIIRQ